MYVVGLGGKISGASLNCTVVYHMPCTFRSTGGAHAGNARLSPGPI